MSKVRVDTIATHDDSVEFEVAEIALLRDEVNNFNDVIDGINSDINSLDASTVKSSATTGAAAIPVGTEAQRPGSPTNGQFRYNSDTNQFEGYQNGAWGQVGGGSPLFSVMWWPQRSAIPAGFVAADGQTLSRLTYPNAWAGIVAGNVPTVADATWNSTPTERGKFTAGNGTSTFRLPDYNGKFAGSLGAVFLRGDGTLSAAIAGVIQRDAFQGHHHTVDPATGIGGWSFDPSVGDGIAAGSNTIKNTAGTYQWVRGPISDGTNGTPRTASETRPLNVTGCWVIKLFGAVVNVGSADAAQLASDYANLAGRVTALAGRATALESKGIKRIAAVALTGQTSVTLSGIPAGVDRITVMIKGASLGATSLPWLRVGTLGGIAGSNYDCTVTNQSGTTAREFTAFNLSLAQSAADVLTTVCTLMRHSGNTWLLSAIGKYENDSNLRNAMGSVVLITSLDRIQLTSSTGATYDAGEISVLYEVP